MVSTTPQIFYPQEKDLVPSVQQAAWALGPVWRVRKISHHEGSNPRPSNLYQVAIQTMLSQPLNYYTDIYRGNSHNHVLYQGKFWELKSNHTYMAQKYITVNCNIIIYSALHEFILLMYMKMIMGYFYNITGILLLKLYVSIWRYPIKFWTWQMDHMQL
jgi:hypothetical protein